MDKCSCQREEILWQKSSPTLSFRLLYFTIDCMFYKIYQNFTFHGIHRETNWLGISVIPNQNMITPSSCPFPKVLYFYFKYLFLFSSVFPWVPGEARKGCEIPWLQAVVSCLTWVMGNELGSSRRTASAFASWFISPASQRYFVSEVWKGHCILCIVGSHLIVWVLRVS